MCEILAALDRFCARLNAGLSAVALVLAVIVAVAGSVRGAQALIGAALNDPAAEELTVDAL